MEPHPFQCPTPRRVLSILLVDDDPDSAFLLQRDLHRAFPSAEIRHTRSRQTLPLLASSSPDLLVSAYRLDGTTGVELIAFLRKSGIRFPIALVSGMPLYRPQALTAGADIFLTYEEAKHIGPELRGLLGQRASSVTDSSSAFNSAPLLDGG